MAPAPYTRCPDCGFIAQPEAMAYTLTDTGDIDWDRAVHVTCLVCRDRHEITPGDLIAADAELTCKRCAASVAYPVGAARVQCTGCGVFLLGPGLSDAQRDELRITEGLAGLSLRETFLAAKRRAGQ